MDSNQAKKEEEVEYTKTAESNEQTRLYSMIDEINTKLDFIINHFMLDKEGLAEPEKKFVNISASGIKFTVDKAVKEGDVMEIKLLLPTYPPVAVFAYGEVKRATALEDGKYEVALEYLDVAPRLDRIIKRMKHVLPVCKTRQVGQVLGNRPAGDCHAVTSEQALLQQVFHHGRGTTHVVQVFHDVLAAWFQIGQERHPVADRLEIINGQRHLHSARHGDKVQHGIGRPTECHNDNHGIFNLMHYCITLN